MHRRESEARFASLVRHATDLITVVGADGVVTYQSPSSERILGYAPELVVGEAFVDLCSPADRERLRGLLDDPGRSDAARRVPPAPLRGPPGGLRDRRHRPARRRARQGHRAQRPRRQRAQGVRAAALPPGVPRPRHEPAEPRPVRRPRAAGAWPARRATTPASRSCSSTSTTSRRSTTASATPRATRCCARSRPGSWPPCARRTPPPASAATSSPCCSRASLGAQHAADVAERILDAFDVPVVLDGKQLSVRPSIGIALAGGADVGSDPGELIRNADAAMYISKRDGKRGYRVFEAAMHADVVERLELRADLQRAIDENQFELHFQPVVRLDTNVVSGVEALVRWRHPERGLVQPAQFIPLAEETGLIVELGRWVMYEGCRQAVELQAAVAVAAHPERQPVGQAAAAPGDRRPTSRGAIEASGIDPTTLVLEITESVMMADAAVAGRRLAELKELGVRLAMDDFGTGYSSLSYLSRFPVDILKMDRSFLTPGASKQAADLAAAIVSLGETLDMQVVAEGIEQSRQMTALRDLGCDLGQGFFFARPDDVRGHDRLARRRATKSSVQHSHEALDRSGGLSRINLLMPLRRPRLPSHVVGHDDLADRRRRVPGGAGLGGLRALERADRAVAGVDRDDRADDRPAARRRGRLGPLRPAPGDDRRRRRAGRGRRADGAARGDRVAEPVGGRRRSSRCTAAGTAFFSPAFDAVVPDVLPPAAPGAGQRARPARCGRSLPAGRAGHRRHPHRHARRGLGLRAGRAVVRGLGRGHRLDAPARPRRPRRRPCR